MTMRRLILALRMWRASRQFGHAPYSLRRAWASAGIWHA